MARYNPKCIRSRLSVHVPDPYILPPGGPALNQALDGLPAGSGVYAFSVSGNPPHLSWSVNLKRRLTRLAARFGERLPAVSCWPAGSRLEISLLLYNLAKAYYPGDYLKRLRLRPPWFVGIANQDPFPRLEILSRPTRGGSGVFGPFPSRDLAQRYEQEVLSLFQLRRCTEALAPHPAHPGCIYGEMNQCLRPCQAAVTRDEYLSESARVADFLLSNGKGSIAALSAARERAAGELNFEQASQIHKRLEKITAAAGCRDQVVTSLASFNGVALTKGLGKLQFSLWPMTGGVWQAPVTLSLAGEAHAKSLDQELRELLTAALETAGAGNQAEHLAIFSRWYYSSWRDGHWFPFQRLADLNYRRLVKAISSMAKAE